MSNKIIVIGSLLAVAAGLGIFLYIRKRKNSPAPASVPTAAAALPSTSLTTTSSSSPAGVPAAAAPPVVLSADELAAIVAQQDKQHYCTLPIGSPFMSWISQPDTKIGYVQKKYGIPAEGGFSPMGSTSFGPSALMRVNLVNQEYGCQS